MKYIEHWTPCLIIYLLCWVYFNVEACNKYKKLYIIYLFTSHRSGEVSRRSSFTSRYNSWGRDLIERTGRRKGEECDKLIKANPKLMIQNIEIITKIRVLTNKIGNTRANGCRTTAHQSSKLLTTTYQWFPI